MDDCTPLVLIASGLGLIMIGCGFLGAEAECAEHATNAILGVTLMVGGAIAGGVGTTMEEMK